MLAAVLYTLALFVKVVSSFFPLLARVRSVTLTMERSSRRANSEPQARYNLTACPQYVLQLAPYAQALKSFKIPFRKRYSSRGVFRPADYLE